MKEVITTAAKIIEAARALLICGASMPQNGK
jgi:hypothetical protein